MQAQIKLNVRVQHYRFINNSMIIAILKEKKFSNPCFCFMYKICTSSFFASSREMKSKRVNVFFYVQSHVCGHQIEETFSNYMLIFRLAVIWGIFEWDLKSINDQWRICLFFCMCKFALKADHWMHHFSFVTLCTQYLSWALLACQTWIYFSIPPEEGIQKRQCNKQVIIWVYG